MATNHIDLRPIELKKAAQASAAIIATIIYPRMGIHPTNPPKKLAITAINE